MLEHEWRELEALCERLSDLRHRQSHAERSKNVGLCEGLREDIARAGRQREQLVQHISARLAAGAHQQEHAARGTPPPDAEPQAAEDNGGDSSDVLVGFSR